MKFKICFLPLFLFYLFMTHESCRKEPICACGVEHPEENIKWLKDIITRAYSIDVFQYYFDGTEYIILADPPGPDEAAVVYDCEGNFKCYIGGIFAGSINNCYLTSTFWDSYNKKRILIYQQRIHPK
jgi:hypothetical protein